mgnify:CR=1 FL=1
MLYKFCFCLLLLAGIHCSAKKENKSRTPGIITSGTTIPAVEKQVHNKAAELLVYAGQNNCASDIAFLIDMKEPSGAHRFFVYRFKDKKIINRGLVTHGNCGEAFLGKPRYGNTVGCNCSSLGKYKIGNRYYGRFGMAYKLHGLEKTNSRAFERYVVLHSHSCVPDEEVSPSPICESNGCPTVSPEFLKTAAAYIDKSKKPVLLWIYE